MTIWDKLKYFKRSENWGDPDKINNLLLSNLDKFREYIGVPVIITCGTQGQHVENSYHYQGLAVDIVIPERNGRLLDMYLNALKFPFSGVGIYPDWRYDDARVGGLHLDMRGMDRYYGLKATWLGVKDKKGETHYMAPTQFALETYILGG